MERMWSPWRSELLNRERHTPSDDGEQSLFLRLVSEQKDEENLILWRGERVFVIMNAFPYNNGHLMVVPYREVAQYEALTRDEQVDIAVTIDHCIRWLRTALKPEGFNVGMNLGKAAGAGLPRHMHVHVVPRWSGDTNFMPTIGEVKVIPEAIRETYEALRKVVASHPARP